jgi:hypothetical protein
MRREAPLAPTRRKISVVTGRRRLKARSARRAVASLGFSEKQLVYHSVLRGCFRWVLACPAFAILARLLRVWQPMRMRRWQVGCWLVACSLVLGCGEAADRNDTSTGGAASEQGGAGGGESSGSSAGGLPANRPSAGEAAAYFQPGSRLKPRVFAPDQSVEVLRDVVLDASWYDSELELDCFFAPDEAGVERCFPRQFLTGGAYADAECTKRVLLDSAAGSCGALRYPYVLADSGSCSYSGFRVGEQLPASTPLFYSDGSACQPSSQDPSIPIYEVEPVPAETFVAMARRPRARAPGLDAYVREGDDGSWQVMGYFDAARSAPCFDSFIEFEPLSKCVPSHASASGFAESTCRTHIASVQQTSCSVERPTAIITAQADAATCPMTRAFELFEIEATREIPRHELDDSGACVTSSLPPNESYVQGAAIDASTLPTLETLVVGTGSVRGVFSGFGGVPYVPLGYANTGLVDAAGEPCLPFRFPDGSLRCVPTSFASATPSSVFYEDAACDGPLLVPWAPKPTCPADPPLPRGVKLLDPTECELVATELMAVEGQSAVDTVYAKDPATGACQARPGSSPAPTYLRLGRVLDAAELPDLKPSILQE